VSASSTQTNVYIDPPSKEALVNQTFSISVSITNVTDLYRWDFELWYTTAHINAISVTEGPFLKADGAQTSFGPIKINDAYNATHGHIMARCVRAQTSGVSGSGVLATISFKAASIGSSDLLFTIPKLSYPVKLTDPKLEIIACTATGGTVMVKSQISPFGPKAIFTASPATSYPGDSVTFSASASKAGCNGTHMMPITWYDWNFGDNATSNATDPTANHTYTSVGNYTVTLTVQAPGATPENDTTTLTIIVTSPTMVFIDPPLKEVLINLPFSVDIRIANVTNLFGYEFTLYYNGTILDYVSFDLPFGHFLEPVEPMNIYQAPPEINDALGFAKFAISLLSSELPRNGGGILAKITFNATVLGSSNLTFYDPDHPYPVLLSNPNAIPIPCAATSGTINVVSEVEPYGPHAEFTIPLKPGEIGLPLYVNEPIPFDASLSRSGCNGTHGIPITLYSWKFGDSPTSNGTGLTINHTYTSVGNYTVTLTVHAPGATPETDTFTYNITIGIRPVEPPAYPPEDIWIILGIIIGFPTIAFSYSRWSKILSKALSKLLSKIWPKRRKTGE